MVFKKLSFLMVMVLYSDFVQAETLDIDGDKTSEKLDVYSAAEKMKWELAAVAGSAIFLGLKSWNWGSSNSFKFNDEGWFGADTGSAGADKLGHMYSSYLINELFTKSLFTRTEYKEDAAKYAALYSSTIMLLVEVFDGYSVDHGFSYEDLVFNSLGIGLSYLKNTIPGLDEKLDLRVEYLPTYEPHSNHPVTDYSGYTYIAALRLGGFESYKDTPLKYMELHLGYHAEGFKSDEERYYPNQTTEFYAGISFNLTELFFKPVKKYIDSPLLDYADTVIRYYQIPKTYLSIPLDTRVIPYE
jgi:hypothetical protein